MRHHRSKSILYRENMTLSMYPTWKLHKKWRWILISQGLTISSLRDWSNKAWKGEPPSRLISYCLINRYGSSRTSKVRSNHLWEAQTSMNDSIKTIRLRLRWWITSIDLTNEKNKSTERIAPSSRRSYHARTQTRCSVRDRPEILWKISRNLIKNEKLRLKPRNESWYSKRSRCLTWDIGVNHLKW